MRIIGIIFILLIGGKAIAQPKTLLGRQFTEEATSIKTLLADTSFVIAPGVEETDLHYINSKGQPMHVFILQVNLQKKYVHLRLVTAGNTDRGRKTLSNMISNNGDSGHIVAGVNADFFNLDTGIPLGILYKDGMVLKDTFTSGKSQQGITYLGVQKRKRRVIIGSKGDRRPPLFDAAGGGVYLVKNYQPAQQTTHAIHPRTAVGITGKQVLYFIVADGRNASWSNGMNYTELSQLFKSLHVKDAINLDGGGSSTFIIRNPQGHALELRNRPSDGGERAISNGWVIAVN